MHLHVHISASKQRHTHVTRYMHKTHNSTLIHTQSLLHTPHSHPQIYCFKVSVALTQRDILAHNRWMAD